VAEARVPSLRNRDKTINQPQIPQQKVEVRRSQRRRRTVNARMEGDTLIVMIPAKMTRAEEKHWVAEMQRKLLRRIETLPALPVKASDEALLSRCAQLAAKYLDDDATPASVRWVPPMRTRWASCTPVDATIRVSERLRDVPSWVLDYVLVHELAHLRVPGHNAEFWALVQRYPKAERAIGFLEGLSAAAGLNITAED
jgi:predicted metal-dependent hydrolase